MTQEYQGAHTAFLKRSRGILAISMLFTYTKA